MPKLELSNEKLAIIAILIAVIIGLIQASATMLATSLQLLSNKQLAENVAATIGTVLAALSAILAYKLNKIIKNL